MKKCIKHPGERFSDSVNYCHCGEPLVNDIASDPEVIVKRKIFEKKIEDYPDNVENYLLYGEYLRTVELYSEAIVQFCNAMEIESNNSDTIKSLIECYIKSQQHNKACDLIIKNFDLLKNDTDILVIFLESSRKNIDITLENNEIIKACKIINSNKPFEFPICSLVLGVANEKISRETGQRSELVDAEKLLTHALSDKSILKEREISCAMLHLCSARLLLDGDLSQTFDDILEINKELLQPNELTLLANCLYLAGKNLFSNSLLDKSIIYTENSLNIASTPEAREQLAKNHEAQGDFLCLKKRYNSARKEYLEALKYRSEQADILKKINHVNRRLRKRYRNIGGVVGTTIALVALFFYGRGSLIIQTNLPASITLLEGENIIAKTESDRLATQLLLFRSYLLKISKPGFANVEQTVTPAFGRGSKELDKFILKPIYGAINVSSDPTGATVVVKNQYEEKSCTTPCELKQLYSTPSTIEVRLSGFEPFRSNFDVPVDSIYDFGVVTFKGDLKVDSSPSNAEVFINGKLYGQTPLNLKNLPSIKTDLEIRKKGVGLYATNLSIGPGKEIDLGTVTLSNLAAIKVDSLPQGATVKLDGKLQDGKAPLTLNNLQTGKHNIRIEYPGVKPVSKDITIGEGELLDLGTIFFQGDIKVSSEPQGADVFIDKEKKGITPITINGILAKDVTVKLVTPDNEILIPCSIRPGEVTDTGIIYTSMPLKADQSWNGSYMCGQDSPSVNLKIVKIMGDKIEALLSFNYNKGRISGDYYVIGQYNFITRNLNLIPGKWVNRPYGFNAIGLNGTISKDGENYAGIITSSGCSTFNISLSGSKLQQNNANNSALPSVDVLTPIHKLGDTYVTEAVNSFDMKSNFKTERRVIGVESDKIIVESKSLSSKKGTVRTLVYTPEWNVIRSRNPDGEGFDYSPPLRYFDFPLHPGKNWNQTCLETNSKTGAKRTHVINGSVGDWDTVTVPSGTFKAIKVVLKTELIDQATGLKTTGRDISWYVPELRRTVKSETSSTKPDGSEENQIIHLLEYKINN